LILIKISGAGSSVLRAGQQQVIKKTILFLNLYKGDKKMKFSLVLAAALAVATALTACGDPKPAQYPPSMSMERDSMPDNVDKTEQNKK